MSEVGFELKIPLSERGRKFVSLTVIGTSKLCDDQMAESILILNSCLLKRISPTNFYVKLVLYSDFMYDFSNFDRLRQMSHIFTIFFVKLS
jgi:hypothetical protein